METNALPASSFTALSIIARYLVSGEKFCSARNMQLLLSGLKNTVPAMLPVVVPSFFTVNVSVLIVEESIRLLNDAETSELSDTSEAPSRGKVSTTAGGALSFAVAFVTAATAATARLIRGLFLSLHSEVECDYSC